MYIPDTPGFIIGRLRGYDRPGKQETDPRTLAQFLLMFHSGVGQRRMAMRIGDMTCHGQAIYRDAYHVIYRRDPYYVIYDVYTRRQRFYTDIRDVVRTLNRFDDSAA